MTDTPVPLSTKLTGAMEDLVKRRVQAKLESYLPTATDSVLCDYVLVMVGNRKTDKQISNDLDAFLGPAESEEFAKWLWELLASVENKTVVLDAPPAQSSAPKKDPSPAARRRSKSRSRSASRSRSRDRVRSPDRRKEKDIYSATVAQYSHRRERSRSRSRDRYGDRRREDDRRRGYNAPYSRGDRDQGFGRRDERDRDRDPRGDPRGDPRDAGRSRGPGGYEGDRGRGAGAGAGSGG